MELLLVRHGITQYNADRVFMGYDPIPLSAEGRRQMERLAERLHERGLKRIVASDVLRARESAAIVAEKAGLAVETDPALREVDVGEAKGLSYADAMERWPGIFSADGETRFPGGESFVEVADRAAAYLRRSVIREEAGPVMVVTHAGVVRGAAARLLKRPLSEIGVFSVDNASLTEIRVASGVATLVAWNDTTHLRTAL